MGKVACIVVILLVVMEIGAARNYCQICENHTMCLYQGFGPKCSRRVHRGVTKDSDKSAVLEIHNRHRQFVAQGREQRGEPGPQPAATNMEILQWDDELATIAQRWADQCNFSHDMCRNTDRYEWVGQNLYISGIWRSNGVVTDDVQDWEKAIGAFYNEVEFFNNKNVDKMGAYPSSNATGHYTQLVWGKTNRVGCGFISFMDKENEKDWYKKYYVCDYGPGGNVLGQRVYERKDAPSGSDRCAQGLCMTMAPLLPPWIRRWFPNQG